MSKVTENAEQGEKATFYLSPSTSSEEEYSSIVGGVLDFSDITTTSSSTEVEEILNMDRRSRSEERRNEPVYFNPIVGQPAGGQILPGPPRPQVLPSVARNPRAVRDQSVAMRLQQFSSGSQNIGRGRLDAEGRRRLGSPPPPPTGPPPGFYASPRAAAEAPARIAAERLNSIPAAEVSRSLIPRIQGERAMHRDLVNAYQDNLNLDLRQVDSSWPVEKQRLESEMAHHQALAQKREEELTELKIENRKLSYELEKERMLRERDLQIFEKSKGHCKLNVCIATLILLLIGLGASCVYLIYLGGHIEGIKQLELGQAAHNGSNAGALTAFRESRNTQLEKSLAKVKQVRKKLSG